jgi:hypothetical protein
MKAAILKALSEPLAINLDAGSGDRHGRSRC